jgi:peptidoglycan/xylan/chitin deacetylase (PgdA/CDA1 family)
VRLLLLFVLLATSWSGAEARKRIAFSFDDVPRAQGAFFTSDQRTKTLISAMRRAGIRQAAFFVTTGNLEQPDGAGGERRIERYVAAGHVIANHSHSHRWLHRTDVAAYVEDIDRAATWLSGRKGYRPWYRFPYLDEGRRDIAKRDAVRAALKERGLRNGYVTIDNYDWHLENLASQACRDGRPIDLHALEKLYVETLLAASNFYERIAADTLGRSPVHVLLLHETDIAAMFVDDLAAALRRDGWEIVPIDEAYRDPIAATEPDSWFLNAGRIAALAHTKGKAPRDLMHERTDEEVLSRLFNERVLEGRTGPCPRR